MAVEEVFLVLRTRVLQFAEELEFEELQLVVEGEEEAEE